jgi:hypothetical protein
MQLNIPASVLTKYSRSEEEIVGKLPILVKFGETEYKIKPLTILKAGAWRDKLVTEVNEIVDSLKGDGADSNAFTDGLAFVFLKFPQKVFDLVKSYAPDLEWEKIADEATEEQLSRAFGQIMVVAFPFLGELGATMQALQTAAKFSAPAKRTN